MTRGKMRDLTPDHTFLIQEIFDDFDAIAHLRLCALGHGYHGPADFPRLNVIKGWDTFGPALLKLLFVASHALPPAYDPFCYCHASPHIPSVLIA